MKNEKKTKEIKCKTKAKKCHNGNAMWIFKHVGTLIRVL